MAQRPPSPADRPDNRRDATRPPHGGWGANGTPYPGAPTPARGTTDTTRPPRADTSSRNSSQGRPAAPTPATVWAAGPDPIDPEATWPVPIIEAITTSFSAPGARVLLAPWPTPTANPFAPTASPADNEIAAARAAVDSLGRTASVARLALGGVQAGGSSHPFWADFITDSAHSTALPKGQTCAPSETPDAGVHADAGDRAPGRADLIITVLPADRSDDGSVDAVALAAAGLLTFGGILAVYTHSHWYTGRLVDPSGSMVAAGQSADLVYLQHIITLHTPIHDGHLQPPSTGDHAEYGRAAHRAAAQGLPAPHLRAHGDVLVFAQAREHQPPTPNVPAPDGAPDTSR